MASSHGELKPPLCRLRYTQKRMPALSLVPRVGTRPIYDIGCREVSRQGGEVEQRMREERERGSLSHSPTSVLIPVSLSPTQLGMRGTSRAFFAPDAEQMHQMRR